MERLQLSGLASNQLWSSMTSTSLGMPSVGMTSPDDPKIYFVSVIVK